jgi:acetoin utilization deacetylase AcuC-like enzyme
MHDRAYIEKVRTLVRAGGGRLDADTVASEGSWDAARAAAGAALDGVDFAMRGDSVCSATSRSPRATRSSVTSCAAF